MFHSIGFCQAWVGWVKNRNKAHSDDEWTEPLPEMFSWKVEALHEDTRTERNSVRNVPFQPRLGQWEFLGNKSWPCSWQAFPFCQMGRIIRLSNFGLETRNSRCETEQLRESRHWRVKGDDKQGCLPNHPGFWNGKQEVFPGKTFPRWWESVRKFRTLNDPKAETLGVRCSRNGS